MNTWSRGKATNMLPKTELHNPTFNKTRKLSGVTHFLANEPNVTKRVAGRGIAIVDANRAPTEDVDPAIIILPTVDKLDW